MATIFGTNSDTRVVPSLDLRFSYRKDLIDTISARNIDYSRSSGGTYVDENGVIQSAASGEARFDHNPVTGESLGLLVEETRKNYFQNSASLGRFSTISGLNKIPYQEVAPDGTFTASRYTITTSNVNHYIRANYIPYQETGIPFGGAGSYALSVFIKPDNHSKFVFMQNFSSDWESRAAVDLDTGSISYGRYIAGTPGLSVEEYKNGWYRIEFRTSVTSWPGTYFLIFAYDTLPSGFTSNTTTKTRYNYAGDGSSGFYLWGSSLEYNSRMTSYIPTPATFTSRASTATYYDASGTIQTAASGIARSDAYLPDENGVMQPVGLLLEPTGTNLLNGSETFATSGGTQNDWVDTNITRDGTLRTSPDGTDSALRVSANAANASIISSSAIGSSAERTFSIFLRRVTGTGDIQYTLDNGSTWTTQTIMDSWRRYAFPPTTADQQIGIRIVDSGDEIELWGAQLESGFYATSYIPTTTSTVTRSADSSSSPTVTRSADVAQITGSDFSSWYNQSEGTVFTESTPSYTGDSAIWTISDGTADERMLSYSGGSYSFHVVDNGTSQVQLDIGGYTATSKAASAYKQNDFAYSINGSTVGIDTSGTIPTVDRLRIMAGYAGGQIQNGNISRLTYYPIRLSNTTLSQLTK